MLLSIAERLELRKHHPCQHFMVVRFSQVPESLQVFGQGLTSNFSELQAEKRQHDTPRNEVRIALVSWPTKGFSTLLS